jgi:endoglucanase
MTLSRQGVTAANAPADLPCPSLSCGISLHHLLNWPETTSEGGRTDYVWPPFATPNYRIRDEELSRLKAMGFDFLRVTADPSIFITASQTRLSYLTRLVRQTVNRLIRADFSVIFDLHPVAVNPAYDPLKLVKDIHSAEFQGYAGIVEHLAKALDDLPHERCAFELMNEPWLEGKAGMARWQPMMELLHTRARKGSATLPLVLTGAAWGDAKALRQLDLAPFKGSNVFYSFHYYDPHTYTHQGVAGDEAEFLVGLQWPVSHDNIVAVRDAAFARIETTKKPPAAVKEFKEMTRKLLSDYELTAHDGNRIQSDFAAVAAWAREQGVPARRILLGEFGCVRSSHAQPLGADRVQWLRAIRHAAQEFGFPWALWACKGYGGMALFDEQDRMDAGIAEALGLTH